MKEYIIKVDETVEIDKRLFDNIIDVKRLITCKDCERKGNVGKELSHCEYFEENDYCSLSVRKNNE